TEECALAAAGYRAIRRLYPLGFNQEVQIAKRDFHRVVRRAKRLYWRNLINSFSDSSSVFKAVRWLRSPGAFQPPPLQVDDVVYETQLDKANALRRATLERRTAEDDIQDPWIEVSPRKTIPFPHEISLEEAQDATLHTGNTSPGADNITVKLLTAVWHIIGTHVRRLFEGCLAIGYHPKPFRAAEVVIIAKPGRRDLTNPRAWRPISLLSCLGKGLERYQDTITPLSPLQCGLPQGSPVSPILFLLYTEPIYRLSNPQGRFGYADDTAILCVGDTVEETAATASRSVEEMVRWGAANGVSFDPKKTEVMHFSRSKLKSIPAIRHGDFEKHPETVMRWLGIWLDSNLSFRVYAEKWTAKSQAVTHHLRGLTNTIHGPLPSAIQSAIRACVKPVLLYGTEVWYPGATRPRWDQPSKDRPSSIQHLLQRINKAIVQSMRAILPVWKTTPIAILHRESRILPIDQLLKARRYRFSARLKSLDKAHPLAKRMLPPKQPTYHQLIKRKYQAPTESSFRTRLRRTNELLAPCPRPALLQKYFGKGQDTPLQTAPKGESAEAFL
ncbi:hypothetical protein BFJ69_g17922, partial [Fusarium oxysporum]